MRQRFLDQGYASNVINEAYNMVLHKPRSELLQKSQKKNKEFSVTCATTFSPKSSMLKNTVLKHWHLLSSDPALGSKFKDPPLFVYKRAFNLHNKLVRASFSTGPTQSLLAPIRDGNYPCGNCAQCHYTSKAFNFGHPSGKRYPIKGIITCNTKNVIYILKCPCDLLYVGKTSRSLKIRISKHKCRVFSKN